MSAALSSADTGAPSRSQPVEQVGIREPMQMLRRGYGEVRSPVPRYE